MTNTLFVNPERVQLFDQDSVQPESRCSPELLTLRNNAISLYNLAGYSDFGHDVRSWRDTRESDVAHYVLPTLRPIGEHSLELVIALASVDNPSVTITINNFDSTFAGIETKSKIYKIGPDNLSPEELEVTERRRLSTGNPTKNHLSEPRPRPFQSLMTDYLELTGIISNLIDRRTLVQLARAARKYSL